MVQQRRSPEPTPPSERIVALDALRGFAILGILVINVWFFGLPVAGAVLPPAYGDFTGANYLAWLVSHVFFEMKFITLFTIMFGAGVVLFTESKERRGEPTVRLHHRRTLLLLAAGLGHAYLLWYGDILVAYAICGLIVVYARGWSPRRLVVIGLALLAVPSLLMVGSGVALAGFAPADERAAVEEEMMTVIGATDEAIAAELAAYRGGYLEQFAHRAPMAFRLQTAEFVAGTGWRVAGLMLVGMALMKHGVLANERSTRWYRGLLLGGVAVGLPSILAGVWYVEIVDWDPVHALFLAQVFNYWGSIPLALAYLAGVMLWCERRPTGAVTGGLAAVGRTAFSNYLLQTLLATSVFYGHGLGLFGTLSRLELLGIVLAIWTIQVTLSIVWLRRYRYGPVEWIWRTLTYGERQPLRVPR